jgi:peptide/nickel transport system substrate-binding protein
VTIKHSWIMGRQPVAGHAFISYSRHEASYVQALVAHLRAAGVNVWADHELHYGERWPAEIRERVDTCAVMVPVMTPSAEQSVWVEREIGRAEALGKPIAPLLLAGTEFFHLTGVQYEDVRDGRMPRPEFVAWLRHLTTGGATDTALLGPPIPATGPQPPAGPHLPAGPQPPAGPHLPAGPQPPAGPPVPPPVPAAPGHVWPTVSAPPAQGWPVSGPPLQGWPTISAPPSQGWPAVSAPPGRNLAQAPAGWPVWVRRSLRTPWPYTGIALVLALAVVLVVVTRPGPTPPNPNSDGPSSSDTPAAASTGPAPAVVGATRGGTLTVVNSGHFAHLDPARSYENGSVLLNSLVTRTLTTYQEIPQPNGTVTSTLVGDLAVNTGTDVHHDCKTWRYTLKDGLKYENGIPVTAADVAYGIARSFSPDYSDGPHYLQNWLTGNASASTNYNKTYRGPYDNGATIPPGVTVKDNTITFTFAQPECDLPYVVALPMSAAVPPSQDTRDDYDSKPFADGPYRIASHTSDSLTLTRNLYWDPATDAVHTAYPDQIIFDFTAQPVVDDFGKDTAAVRSTIAWATLASQDAAGLTEAARGRIVQGPTQGVQYLDINNGRVTDATVRKALNTALDKGAVLDAAGGDTVGAVLNTIDPPTTLGWRDYDVFGVGPHGDATKARGLLAGQTPKLTLCFLDPDEQPVTAAIGASLEKAGFVITLKPIHDRSILSGRTNTCDLYLDAWLADYPSAATVIAQLFDGRSITSSGNLNRCYYSSSATSAEIDRIERETSPDQAAQDWASLDRKIMAADAPVIPLFNMRIYDPAGSNVGGAFASLAYDLPSLNRVYLKSPAASQPVSPTPTGSRTATPVHS